MALVPGPGPRPLSQALVPGPGSWAPGKGGALWPVLPFQSRAGGPRGACFHTNPAHVAPVSIPIPFQAWAPGAQVIGPRAQGGPRAPWESETSGPRLPSEQPAAAMVAAAAMAPSTSIAPAEGTAAHAQLRRLRAATPADAILAAGAIVTAGPDTKAAATIAAAGCSDSNLEPDFSDAHGAHAGPGIIQIPDGGPGAPWGCQAHFSTGRHTF